MIIAELADGRSLKLPDDTPDEVVDATVMLHIQVAELVKAVRDLQESNREMKAAFLAPRKITVERDFKDEKVMGAVSTVKKETGNG